MEPCRPLKHTEWRHTHRAYRKAHLRVRAKMSLWWIGSELFGATPLTVLTVAPYEYLPRHP
jgi:hypothetical protein